MTIRRSYKSTFGSRRRRKQEMARRREAAKRGMQLERLEERQLLAELVSIQTNDGRLLNNADVLNVSPRDFTFLFNETAEIDPSTLDGIQITGSGFDNVFDTASIKTDFNTGGQV